MADDTEGDFGVRRFFFLNNFLLKIEEKYLNFCENSLKCIKNGFSVIFYDIITPSYP